MNKIYMVRSYFEDYESSKWQIIGLYTDKKVAEEIAKKWKDFYVEKYYSIFNEPISWRPTDKDLVFSEGNWEESEEYSNRVYKYLDIKNFREIEIEDFDLNRDLSLGDHFMNEDLLSLMKQWDRDYKLGKLI